MGGGGPVWRGGKWQWHDTFNQKTITVALNKWAMKY